MSREQLDEVLAAVLASARHELRDDGALRPFGAALTAAGRVLRVEARAGAGADREAAIETIANELRGGARRDAYVAACVCTQVSLEDEEGRGSADAVRAHMEDADGEVVDVFLPFRVGDDSSIEWGDLFAHEGEPQLFPRSS